MIRIILNIRILIKRHSHSHQTMRMFCECEYVCKSLHVTVMSIRTSADCSAKNLISNLAGILDSSSEDEDFDLESGNNWETQEREIKAQLKAYFKEKRASTDENLMDWRKTKLKYDKLSHLAHKYLTAPPVSVPSGQLFSPVGLIYEPLRNRLICEKAAKLLFIKYKLALLKFDY